MSIEVRFDFENPTEEDHNLATKAVKLCTLLKEKCREDQVCVVGSEGVLRTSSSSGFRVRKVACASILPRTGKIVVNVDYVVIGAW